MGARAVIRVIFDRQSVDGLIFDLPIQQVTPAPAGSTVQHRGQCQQRPEQQPVHRDNKECEWPTR
jgi:hypothetical protein